MKTKASKRLRRGDRVMWNKQIDDQGTVLSCGGRCVEIRWDNGRTGLISHWNMQLVTLVCAAWEDATLFI